MVPDPPRLSLALEIHVQVGAPIDIGEVGGGRRRIVPILGGTFVGPGLSGRVLPGGADWQIVRADGFQELDTRYTLETDAGDLVYVQNAGIRRGPAEVMQRLIAGEPVDQSLVYMRTVPKLETAAPALRWLTQSLFVGTGERYPHDVVVRFWRVE